MREPRPSDDPGFLPYAAILAAVVLWGGSFAAMRDTIRTIGALPAMSLRMAIAALALSPFAARLARSVRRSWRKGDGKYLLLTVLFQPCLYFLCESNALRFTSASQAGLVSATVPILTALGARAVLRESLGARTLVGIALASAGLAWLTLAGGPDAAAPRPVLGNLLELGAMVCAAANMVAVRSLSSRYDTWALTGLQVGAGLLFFLPGLAPLVRGEIVPTDLPWAALLYLGIASSLGAFGLYNWSMKRVTASRAAAFINLVPVVAAVGAALVLGEVLAPLQAAAGAVVLGGVVLSQGRIGRPRRG